jgi:hypothetical protein
MGGKEGDLVPNLGRRSEVPPQDGARRGGEPLRLGPAAADQRGDAPRESPAPGHGSPPRFGETGRAAESR